jgi:hypothetical protein
VCLRQPISAGWINRSLNCFSVENWHGFRLARFALPVEKGFHFTSGARDQTEFFRVKIIETIRAFGTNSDRFPLCADGENLSTFAASSFASSFHDDFRVTRGAFNKHLVMGLGDMLRKTVILGGADGAATFFTSGFWRPTGDGG